VQKVSGGLLLSLPAILSVLSVTIFPLLFSLTMSFYDMDIVNRKTVFIGLNNYITVLKDPLFFHSLKLTIFYVIFTLSIGMLLGLGYALLLNEKFFGRKILRTFVILPWAIPMVVAGMTWRWILDINYGALDGLLNELGLLSGHTVYFKPGIQSLITLGTIQVWRDASLAGIVFLASLQAIPIELYEASLIDGANSFQRFIRITLPLLKPAILVCMVLLTANAFIQYDLVYMLTSGGPGNDTTIMSWYVYTISFRRYQYSLGMAVSWILTIINFTLAYLYFKLLYKKEIM
jgi:ABC-type sugar transport system permease subunit